ncbi:aminotransferase [Anaerorhabdus sp.]|uniref:aminotransferase n=1 Tax=Anaerorhabdus sp. TaxID=1872524 RepID=UPI002FC76D61
MEIAKFGVEDWLNVWENDAIYDIAGSSIASMTLEEILEFIHIDKDEFMKMCFDKKMNYGWIEGSPEFKEEVCKLYDDVKPEQVLQTNGATGANFIALYGLINRGDHVVSMYPTYQQLIDIPKSFGADVDLWQIHEEDNWLPSIDELKSLVRSNTKMICINNANNPTGSIMDENYLTQVVEIAKSIDAYILCDEVYKPLCDDIKVPSIVDLYDKGIATNSLSKTYSVPGVRVGWVVSNLEVANVYRKIRDYTMICAGVLDDVIATLVLKNKDLILERNRKIVEENLEIVKEWLKTEPRVTLNLPKNVSTSFIKIDVEMNTEEFCIALLKEKGVLLVPGNRFDMPGYARLGYCARKEILIKGLEELSAFLRKFD